MATLAEKRRLNLLEAAIKMEITAQTNPHDYSLEIIDEETGKEMEY